MASVLYNSFMFHLAKGNIDLDTDTFYIMVATAAYTPDVDAHDFRNDVTNEVSGTGYTAGGEQTTVAVTQDNANNRVAITFSPVVFETATITGGRWGIIYKRRGGVASADELVSAIDFGSDKSSSAGDFTVSPSTPIYLTAAV